MNSIGVKAADISSAGSTAPRSMGSQDISAVSTSRRRCRRGQRKDRPPVAVADHAQGDSVLFTKHI